MLCISHLLLPYLPLDEIILLGIAIVTAIRVAVAANLAVLLIAAVVGIGEHGVMRLLGRRAAAWAIFMNPSAAHARHAMYTHFAI